MDKQAKPECDDKPSTAFPETEDKTGAGSVRDLAYRRERKLPKIIMEFPPRNVETEVWQVTHF